VGALEPITEELIDAPGGRFGAMVHDSHTVATQAFQLWTVSDSQTLDGPNRPENISATFEEELDTYCDMSHILRAESWPHGGPGGLAYVCGVLPDAVCPPGTSRADADLIVAANAEAYVQKHAATLWPGRAGSWPNGPLGDEVVEAYCRGNVDPSERYVITPAGSVQYRLRPGESGFANVFLAGDWTLNGIDGGCVEAAVLSGMQAAAAITGASGRVAGEAGDRWLDPPRLRDAGRPSFIEYGFAASSPGPFSCSEVLMRAYMVEGDPWLIKTLIDRTLNTVAGGRVKYVPAFGRHVFLIAGTNLVRSARDPWSTWGEVRETLASFWIPLYVYRAGPRKDPELRMFISHLLVNNPISLYAGREIYGYAKAMASFHPDDGFTPAPHTQAIHIYGFGGNFNQTGDDGVADYRPFLTLRKVDYSGVDIPLPDGEWTDAVAAVARQVHELAFRNTVRQVFLKQFRAAGDQTKACYQAVVETENRIANFDWDRPLKSFKQGWELDVHKLDSHSLATDIGLDTGTHQVRLSYEVAFEFEVRAGYEIARRTR
jgi:hypothetical protein